MESFQGSPLDSAKDHGSEEGSLDLNESSHLLSPQRVQDEILSGDHETLTEILDWNDGNDGKEESKSTFYLFILTLGIGG